MTDQIVDGVIGAIVKEFGETFAIYTETVSQGLQRPCFMVFLESSSVTNLHGNRHQLSAKVDVHFVPEKMELQKSSATVANRLFQALRLIHLADGTLRGKSRNYKIDEHGLRFSVMYDCQFFYQETATTDGAELMELLTVLVQ